MPVAANASTASGRTLDGPEPNRPSAGLRSVGDGDIWGRAAHDLPLSRRLSKGPTPLPSERLSTRVTAIAPSATLAVDAKAKAMKADGEDVIGFGAGEPDFPTPAHIVEAAVEAVRDPATHHYSPTPGLPALRQAIADKTKRDSGYDISPSQVVVTNGGKQAYYEAIEAIVNPGDEVLLPAPYWTTYPEPIALAGGTTRRPPHRRGVGLPGDGRPARGRPHRAHQGARVRVAVEPVGRGLPAGRGRGHRPLGRRARHLGRHRRDLRAPRLRRQRVRVAAGPRARGGRPDRRPQRRGQDLRHDRLAGGLAHRPGRPGRRSHQPAVAPLLERRQRRPAGLDRRPRGWPRRRRHDAGRVRPPRARSSTGCSTRSTA